VTCDFIQQLLQVYDTIIGGAGKNSQVGADRTYAMGQGTIIEQGSYEELLAQQRIYAQL
jgi:ABC-type multidrug transport system fused ATPase/permease subunit